MKASKFFTKLQLRILGVCIVGLVALSAWEGIVKIFQIPTYLLPSPTETAAALLKDWQSLLLALWATAKVTLSALCLAAVTGGVFAALISCNIFLEYSVLPYSVLLQTTPIMAIAPLLIIWFKDDSFTALVICAWFSCVFPIISSTATGFKAVDPNLKKIFQLYQTTRLQSLWRLELPSALPYFFNGLRIGGGLALIGAIGGEFVAGRGGKDAGLAYQILMASYSFQTPKMFAGLFLIAMFGLGLFTALTFAANQILKRFHGKKEEGF